MWAIWLGVPKIPLRIPSLALSTSALFSQQISKRTSISNCSLGQVFQVCQCFRPCKKPIVTLSLGKLQFLTLKICNAQKSMHEHENTFYLVFWKNGNPPLSGRVCLSVNRVYIQNRNSQQERLHGKQQQVLVLLVFCPFHVPHNLFKAQNTRVDKIQTALKMDRKGQQKL